MSFKFPLIAQQKLMIKPWDWLFGFIPQTEQDLRKFITKKHLIWTSSARNALFMLLKELKKQQTKQLTIALPAFTCQVIRDAALRANIKIIYYDYDVDTNIEEFQKLITQKPDLLLLCYNFGYLPENISEIANLCQKHKITLVEDCAQALGATQNNKLAGSFGDYAIYSFGISKNVGFTGGILASDKELDLPKQHPEPVNHIFKKIIESIASSIILNKHLYSLFAKILHKQILEKAKYPNNEFACSLFTKNIIKNLAEDYKKILKNRQENFKIISGKETEAACLYYPIFPKNKEQQQEIIKTAKKQGVELDNLKSFVFLPKTNEDNKRLFPKAWSAAQFHLAIALLRNKKTIQKIAKVINS